MYLYFFLNRTKYNLNALSHDTAINLIRKVLADGVKLTEVCGCSSNRTIIYIYIYNL